MSCADLDELIYLPSRDAALTRRARKYSPLWAVIVHFSRARGRYERPSLLVAPASLLANWAVEIECFAPSLKAIIAHPSELPASDLRNMTAEQPRDVDVMITSYGSLFRVPWLADVSWNLLSLDEAQAIKNPSAKQTQTPRN
jgi:SNF2 family DNA or RNA helicase